MENFKTSDPSKEAEPDKQKDADDGWKIYLEETGQAEGWLPDGSWGIDSADRVEVPGDKDD